MSVGRWQPDYRRHKNVLYEYNKFSNSASVSSDCTALYKTYFIIIIIIIIIIICLLPFFLIVGSKCTLAMSHAASGHSDSELRWVCADGTKTIENKRLINVRTMILSCYATSPLKYLI